MDFLTILKYAVIAVCAYLCGSFSTSIFVGKIFYGIDVRKYGSGNAGASNTLRTMGAKKAVLVLLGDMVKVIIPVVVAQLLGLEYAVFWAGSFALVGHALPVFHGFKGGKGVACAAAIILLYDIRLFLLLVLIFILVLLATKIVSVGTFSMIFAVQVYVWIFDSASVVSKVYFACLGIYLLYLHRANITRLLNGTENKISKKSALAKKADTK